MHSLLPLALFISLFVTIRSARADVATVLHVTDSGTLVAVLKGKTERVRLLGVDDLEMGDTEKLGRETQRNRQVMAYLHALARPVVDFVKTLARRGDQIVLEYDQQRRDQYGRLRAFVWLADGRMLNETIICAGYSRSYPSADYVRREYMARFFTCADEARAAGKGRWKTLEPRTPDSVEPVQPAEYTSLVTGS